MILSYKYRLYPTPKQEKLLLSTLNTCRHTYNDALEQRKSFWKEQRISLSYVDQAKYLTRHKSVYQEQVFSQVLQNVLKRVDSSFKRFFGYCRKRKQGIKTSRVGFPRFRFYNRYRSFTYPQAGFRITNNQDRVELSKLGLVRFVNSRSLSGKIKTCQVVRDVDQWYVIFTCKKETTPVIHNNHGSIVGVDVGLKNFCMLSTGQSIENPRLLRQSERLLKRQQRVLSRKQMSNNREKQRIRVARLHRRIRFQRNDFLHKTSRWLADNFETIVFEDLVISSMVRNHNKLAKSIADASWNRLVQLTTYKAGSAGGSVVLVNPKNLSQRCSWCGLNVFKDLSIRIHECPHCGHVEDRDLNAAKNILQLGTSTVGHTGINHALGDFSSTQLVLETVEQEGSLSKESTGF